jgi:hypothetical protein
MCNPGQLIEEPFEQIGNWASQAWAESTQLVSQLLNDAQNGFNYIAGQLNDLGGIILSSANDVIQFVGDEIQLAYNGVSQTVQNGIASVENLANSFAKSLGSDLQQLGNEASDFLKQYGHLVVDAVADFFFPGSSILIDILWSEAQNGWKPISLQNLGVAAAEGLADEALPGIDSAISDALPSVAADVASGALDQTISDVAAYAATHNGQLPPLNQFVSTLGQNTIDSVLGDSTEIQSALTEAIPGLNSTAEIVQNVADGLISIQETAADLQSLTQGQLVGLAQLQLSSITSVDSSVLLDADQVLALEAGALTVDAPLGDVVALGDQAAQIASYTAYELEALAQTGVTVIAASDNASVILNLAQVDALEAYNLSIKTVSDYTVSLSDTAANIGAVIGGLGDAEIEALRSAGVDTIIADANVVLSASQAIAAAAAGLNIRAQSGVVSLMGTATDIEELTLAQIEALKSVGVQKISAATSIVLDVPKILALEAAGIVISTAANATASLLDTGQQIADLTLQQISALSAGG